VGRKRRAGHASNRPAGRRNGFESEEGVATIRGGGGNLVNAYQSQGDFSTAIKYHTQCLRMTKEVGGYMGGGGGGGEGYRGGIGGGGGGGGREGGVGPGEMCVCVLACPLGRPFSSRHCTRRTVSILGPGRRLHAAHATLDLIRTCMCSHIPPHLRISPRARAALAGQLCERAVMCVGKLMYYKTYVLYCSPRPTAHGAQPTATERSPRPTAHGSPRPRAPCTPGPERQRRRGGGGRAHRPALAATIGAAHSSVSTAAASEGGQTASAELH
jgi:hypothetical protein